MLRHRCYCERIAPGPCELSADEARHAASALRVHVGDALEVFDGRGRVAEATVQRVSRQIVTVEVKEVRPAVPRAPVALVLYVAVPKGPRQRFLVEKCTELGVAELRPIIAARSVVRPTAAVMVRWRRHAVEACKQSRQAWAPDIGPPLAFDDALAQASRADCGLIASPEPGAPAMPRALPAPGDPATIAVCIGPEGGFAPDELAAACDRGLRAVSLGPSILRVETAAIVAAAAVHLR